MFEGTRTSNRHNLNQRSEVPQARVWTGAAVRALACVCLRQSCVCIDAFVTTGTIPTVTCASMSYVQIRRAAPALFWAACRFKIHKQSTARHGRTQKRPHVDETRCPEQHNLHNGQSNAVWIFAGQSNQRPRTTARAWQFSRSETIFLTRIRSSLFTGVRGVVDLHGRCGNSVHLRPTSYGPFLHHSKKMG